MVKTVLTLLTAVVAGWFVAGSTTSASAHYRHSGCCGGPIAPTYIYRTTHRVTNVTRYRDVSRTKYVYRPHRIVHVTRIQPVVYVHNVLRVHHHTVGIVRPIHQRMTEVLPTRQIYTNRVINTYDCRCPPFCRR